MTPQPPATLDGMILVIGAVLVAVHLPLRLPRLTNPFTARRTRHRERLRAQTLALARARSRQAETDAFLCRAWAQAEDDLRRERLAALENAADNLEEFYAQL